MEYSHLYHPFWGGFANYRGNHTWNKTMVKLPQGKEISSRKAIMSRKVTRTATSTNDVPQRRSSNEPDMFSTTFGPLESTNNEIK